MNRKTADQYEEQINSWSFLIKESELIISVRPQKNHFNKILFENISNYLNHNTNHIQQILYFSIQVRTLQKKIQSMEGQFDACTEDLFNQTIKVRVY